MRLLAALKIDLGQKIRENGWLPLAAAAAVAPLWSSISRISISDLAQSGAPHAEAAVSGGHDDASEDHEEQ